MEKIERLREKVKVLYEAKHEGRDEWADWLYENHVLIVTRYARELSQRFGEVNGLAEAAALLHDCADAVMSRFENNHAEKSLDIARKLLTESNFTDEEIEIVVNDALANHSCRNGNLPKSVEGQIMATADAKAHLDTDFYQHCLEQWSKSKTPEEIRELLTEKIDRDYNVKIFFPEVKKELKEAYEARKKDFGI